MMRNTGMDRALKENDEAEWTSVMRPSSSDTSYHLVPFLFLFGFLTGAMKNQLANK